MRDHMAQDNINRKPFVRIKTADDILARMLISANELLTHTVRSGSFAQGIAASSRADPGRGTSRRACSLRTRVDLAGFTRHFCRQAIELGSEGISAVETAPQSILISQSVRTMSVSSIDSISPTRPAAATWNDAMNMRHSQVTPMQQMGSMIQQYLMELMMNLLAAAMQNQPSDPTQGGAGQMPGGGPSGPSGTGGNGSAGPFGAGGPSGAGGGNSSPHQALQDSIKELLAALAPLFQAPGQQQMQPKDSASSVANQLGAGAPQSGGSQHSHGAPQAPSHGNPPYALQRASASARRSVHAAPRTGPR